MNKPLILLVFFILFILTTPASAQIITISKLYENSKFFIADIPNLGGNVTNIYTNIEQNTTNNITNNITTIIGWLNISTTICSGTDKVSAINNVTGIVTCSSDNIGIETEPQFNANFTFFNPFYNQTAPAINYFNNNPFNWINTSYNSTYQTYAYNQTTPAISWVQAQNYLKSYTEIDPIWSANYSLYNSSWSSTFNLTYNALINPSNTSNNSLFFAGNNSEFYNYRNNATLTTLCYNSSYMTNTYNSTYDAKISYNTTWNETRANALYHLLNNLNSAWTGLLGYNNLTKCSDTQILKMSGSNWICSSDATGTGSSGANVSTTTCSGTDKVSAINNVTGIVTCSADQTGSGSGIVFTNFNYTKNNVPSTANLTWNQTLILPLSANKNITIECELMQWAAAATTGVQYRVNISGALSQVIIMRYFSSATAIALCQGITNVTCSATASAGTTISPTELYAYARMNTVVGQFTLESKSELNNSYVNVTQGSWCRSIES